LALHHYYVKDSSLVDWKVAHGMTNYEHVLIDFLMNIM
jgi:hypothetical protein